MSDDVKLRELVFRRQVRRCGQLSQDCTLRASSSHPAVEKIAAGRRNWKARMCRQPLVVLFVAGVTVSCADGQRVVALDARASQLEAEIQSLKTSIQQIEQQRSMDEVLEEFASVAYLTPGTDGYSVIETDLGRITVMLANVQPYANGSRITLQFGNLLSAAINGAKAKVEWGRVDEKGTAQNATAKSRDVSFQTSLRAGRWTNVTVVLEGVPATDLGFVRVRDLTHTGITLTR